MRFQCRVFEMKRSTVKIIQSTIAVISNVAPGLCARLALRQWFKTHRHHAPEREVAWASTARQINIPSEHGELNALIWPSAGPKIVLVHGWSGRASQMGAFAKPLNDAGFEVIAVDLPGHGASYGNTGSIPVSAQALSDVEQHFGSIHALIGHSFGGAVCLLAVAEGLQVQAVVTIGSPSKLEWLLDIYVKYLHFGSTAKRKLAQLLEQKLGADIWKRCDVEFTGPDFKTKVMVIHDSNDKEVPEYHADIIANACSAKLLKTSGLGHRRILRNQAVMEEIVNFVSVE